VVNMWNSLHISVISAPSVNCFKSWLDNFWKNQVSYLWFSCRNLWNRKSKWSGSV